MKEHFEALKNHPRIARGWRVWSITPSMDLRWNNGVLQQFCGVRWRHDREQHVGGGYYSQEDTTSEWLNVPNFQPEREII